MAKTSGDKCAKQNLGMIDTISYHTYYSIRFVTKLVKSLFFHCQTACCSFSTRVCLCKDNIQLLYSTHNKPSVIFVTPNACSIVYFCYRNIEEILAEKGETITKLKSDDIIELVAKDLTDGTKLEP